MESKDISTIIKDFLENRFNNFCIRLNSEKIAAFIAKGTEA
jgi:hypothetical protein